MSRATSTTKGWGIMRNIVTMLVVWLLMVTSAAAETGVVYYHTDSLGSVVAATDEDGAVLWREAYRPFGTRMEQEIGSTENTPFYTGKPHDDQTGLSYFGARYYDPHLGRFTGQDPVGVDPENYHSFNRYAYANNNPYKYVDPDGKFPLIPLAFIAYDLYSNYQESGSIGDAVVATAVGAINPLKKAKTVASIASGVGKAAKNTVGGLRAAGQKDAHHIIQDAAAKNLPGYKTNAAPGVQLNGPANKVGTPHYNATQVQRQRGTGTYASERRIGYKALRRGGMSKNEARAQIGHADEYFKGLGVTGSAKMRPVRNRRK